MTIITGLWALFALACCVVGYFIYRDETQARQAQYASHLDQRHAARKRQAQYELTFWKLLAAFITVAVVAFVLAWTRSSMGSWCRSTVVRQRTLLMLLRLCAPPACAWPNAPDPSRLTTGRSSQTTEPFTFWWAAHEFHPR